MALGIQSSKYASTQLSRHGSSANERLTATVVWLWSSSARSPLALPIRTTDGSRKAHQQTDREPLSNSGLMPRLPQSPAMGHLLISPPPLTTRLAPRLAPRRPALQPRRMLHTAQRSSQAVSQRWLCSFLDLYSDRMAQRRRESQRPMTASRSGLYDMHYSMLKLNLTPMYPYFIAHFHLGPGTSWPLNSPGLNRKGAYHINVSWRSRNVITRFVASRLISGTPLTDKGAWEVITIAFHDRLRPRQCRFPEPLYLKPIGIDVKRGELNSAPMSPRDF